MLALVRTGLTGAVYAFDVKRISREVRDFSELIVVSRQHGVVLVFDDRPLDPRDPNDVALCYVMAAFAELDNKTRADLLRRARIAKAMKGEIVCQLPVGFITLPDRSVAFDPETKPAIDYIYEVYRRVGTMRGTVRALNEEGVRVPARYRGRKLEWKEATIDRVHRFLVLPAYCGTFTYAMSEHRPEFGTYQNGLPRRRPVPEADWIKIPDRLPKFITPEEQSRFRERLAGNGFTKRDRPGKGAGLLQGKVFCGICSRKMTVAYPQPNHGAHRYQCTQEAAKSAAKPCMSVQGVEIDSVVEDAFLTVVSKPPIDVLIAALEDDHRSVRTQQQQTDAELERLIYEERIARDRYEQVDPRNRRVAADLEHRLETAIEARTAFEERLALSSPPVEPRATDNELKALCDIVADVPSLWRHDLVGHEDRKRMLACLIEKVIIRNRPEWIEIKIVWSAGLCTEHRRWRRAGVDRLIGERHAEGMTVVDIQRWLATGDPETGQRWARTTAAIYTALRRLGLKPHPSRRTMKPERDSIRALFDQGKTLRQIADARNAAGSRTPSGKPWNDNAVYRALNAKLGRFDRHAESHRALLADAKRRRLTARQTAEEFNAKGVPRVAGRAWTADAVKQRRTFLNGTKRKKCSSGKGHGAPVNNERGGGDDQE